MKYAVEQKFYDNGHVAARVLKANDNEESFQEERKSCDYYFDVFDTREEAEEYYQECLEA